ncbi:hypothetical protein MSAN_02006600 [Mycena sanguinolenta]|uniref:Uncharacterized protein n=1 Tax=Mycena sanguinolenta TaxID=230812 RepID=A0A8H6XKX4_9AGAR|nr:hypothetical protein MSAN_02006600 [Mycena sanguinolenta]
MCEAMKTYTTPYLDFAAVPPPEAIEAHPSSTKAQSPYTDSVANLGAKNPGSYYPTPPATTAEHFGGFSKLPPTGFAPNECISSVRRQTLTKIHPIENRAVAASPCASAGKFKKKESREMAKKAQELAAASEMAVVQCSWNGCAEIIRLKTLPAHLRTTHDVDFSERKKEKVRCLWSRGQPCKSEILAKSLRPHVQSHAKNVLFVKCPTCAQDFCVN